MTTTHEQTPVVPGNPVNLAAVAAYLTRETHDALCRWAKARYWGEGPRRVEHPRYGWVVDITGDWNASDMANAAILHVIESKTDYRGNPATMGDYLIRAVQSVHTAYTRRRVVARREYAALVVARIIYEHEQSIHGTTLPHGDGLHAEPEPDALARVIALEETAQTYARAAAKRRAANVSEEDYLLYQRHVEDGQPLSSLAKDLGVTASSTVKRRIDKVKAALARVDAASAASGWKQYFKKSATKREGYSSFPIGGRREGNTALLVAILCCVAPELMQRRKRGAARRSDTKH